MVLLGVEMVSGRLFRLVWVGVAGFDRCWSDGEKQQKFQVRLVGFQ